MNKPNENIHYTMGRAFFLLFFLFAVAYWLDDSRYHDDPGPVSIEQISFPDNPAIFNKPEGVPDYNISLEDVTLFHLKLHDVRLERYFAGHAATLQIKNEESKFINIKPKLLRSLFIHLKASPEKDLPLIS